MSTRKNSYNIYDDNFSYYTPTSKVPLKIQSTVYERICINRYETPERVRYRSEQMKNSQK